MKAYSKLETAKYNSLAWNFFWFGFIIYTVCYAFPGIDISIKYFQAIQIIGIVLILLSSFYLINWSFQNNYLKIIFSFYMIWSFITMARGFNLEIDFLKTMFFTAPFSIFLYFVPLVIIFKDLVENLRKLIIVIIILNIFYLIYVFAYRDILLYGFSGFYRVPTAMTETFTHFLSFPTAFILLLYSYQKKKRILFSITVLIITFFIVAIRARRGLMFMSLCFMLFSYILFYFTNRDKLLKIILSIAVLGFVIAYVSFTYLRNQHGTFGLITNRIDEDTRKLIEIRFFEDMSTLDLTFGRGINGMYYCPGIDEAEGSFTVNRWVIETGYLQIVLKGGYILLLLYLLIIIPAIIKGLFLSNNSFAKTAAIWIFLYTIFLYPTYVNMFSLTYIIVWVCVAICFDKNVRNMTDEDVLKLFQEKLYA